MPVARNGQPATPTLARVRARPAPSSPLCCCRCTLAHRVDSWWCSPCVCVCMRVRVRVGVRVRVCACMYGWKLCTLVRKEAARVLVPQ